ncbi:hypothetical protein TSAR_004375 [Trichomalopsis sarcophagae]|uniref:Uncharacterized protein n=1 Tax=Trichomalopsis sarcophagae TaxID=543379 RepID=A0A232EQK7_9HYME|nr:hypothetical protein TSAR_004375 [Trichomalopsis sarcophagae]
MDNSSECRVKQRKSVAELEDKISSASRDNDNDSRQESSAVVASEERTTWQTVKYYFNRFRYYHFLVADTLDKYASALCLWLINLYLRLFMGIGPTGPSVLDEPDDN